ncbi:MULTISPECIES: two-component regulator propeller domain-containing protein [unclassified Pseudoalteromonas]|uniref:two-component regulator propeller domain-containing protein n=1 Tax=unclassified Pseudoalteromonas TaxID=194690 RepID=UPI003328C2DF
MKHLGILCVFFVMFTCQVQSQTRLPLSDYFFETWNTRSGLPHNSINSLAQTQDGYLWIATWEGLARFNGQEFKLFTRAEINNLPDSGLRALTPTDDGGLLIAGSRGGISLYQYRQWNTQPSASAMVNHIIKSNDDGFWLALENDGVFYRGANSKHDQAIVHNVSAYRVLEDANGVIWAATSDGLYKIVDQQASLITADDGLPNAAVYTLLLTRQGKLIIGSERGAYILKDAVFTAIHPQLSVESISSLLEDNHGDLWFGTINKGIFRLSVAGLEQLDAKGGLPANRILSLLQDRENSIWVGTNAGLFRLREAPFTAWTTKRGLAGDYVRTVLSHSDGSLWVGSSAGLNKIKNNNVTQIEGAKEGSPYSVLSLLEGEDGDVWIGTYTSGVLKVSNNKITPYLNRSNGLGSNEVRGLLLDSKQRLWIGSAMGLTRVEKDGSLVQFTNEKELPSGFILALSEDNKGNVWIGTGNGVVVFNILTEQFSAISFPAQFAAEYGFGFYFDDDYTWMTTDRGLMRYEHSAGKMAILGREQGLPVDKLFQIVAHKDSFWLSSNRGVIQVDRQHVNHVLDEKQKNINIPLVFQLYDEGDGMLSAQVNGGSTPSATVHKDGTIWFATAKGVSALKPELLQASSKVDLPTMIESFSVNGRATALPLDGETVLLPPNVSRLSFQYAGLSFIMPQRLSFQTQLEGFNKEWVNRQHMTGAEYTNLSAGKYTFKVRAGYPNTQWQQNEQEIRFVIQAHYWQKLSFKLMLFFTFLVTIYAIYKYRLYHYKKVEAELTKRVEKQTQDLQEQANAFAYQATHDQLTDMPNRRAFDSWLAANFATYKQQNKILAIAIMDIDHFKRVNDGWSHIVGDKVICEIAKILKSHCEGEQQVARWGGEEFTLVFPNKTAAEAKLMCELLREEIANNDFSVIAAGLHQVTASFGVSDSNNIDDYDRLLSGADQALYKAKNGGRNRTEIM